VSAIIFHDEPNHKESTMSITEMIDNYRNIRAAHAVAWERADRAFRRWMHGETRNGSAAKRLTNIAENISHELYDAQMQLAEAGINAALINATDKTDTAVHYRLANA
jgi:hypothetical protein